MLLLSRRLIEYLNLLELLRVQEDRERGFRENGAKMWESVRHRQSAPKLKGLTLRR